MPPADPQFPMNGVLTNFPEDNQQSDLLGNEGGEMAENEQLVANGLRILQTPLSIYVCEALEHEFGTSWWLEEIAQDYREVAAETIVAQANGHSFHPGMHIGWAWGEIDGTWYLDFLAEHRMMGMFAVRFFSDEAVERIETPRSFVKVTGDPEQDELAEDEFYQHNRRVYKSLRDRGLLPPLGKNFGSQDMNEFLTSGLDRDAKDSDATEV